MSEVNSSENFVEKHRNLLLILIGLVVVSVAGYGFWTYQKQQQEQVALSKIYQFRSTQLKEFEAGKLSAEELKTAFLGLGEGLLSYESAVVLALDLSRELQKKEKVETALQVLEAMPKTTQRGTVLGHFLKTWMAGLYEDLNRPAEAVQLLEPLLNTPLKLQQAKVYFDLGRLYLKLNQKDQAKRNFEYILENFKENELAYLAKLYIQRTK